MNLEKQKFCHTVLLVGIEDKESKVLHSIPKKYEEDDVHLTTTHNYIFYQFKDLDSFEKGFSKIEQENTAIKDKKDYIKNKIDKDKITLVITRGCAVNFFEFDIKDAPNEDRIKEYIEQQNEIENEYYLIIGRDDGIEEELYSDIVQAFEVAGVKFENFHHELGQFLSENGNSKINVLYIPTIQEFEEQILFCIKSQIGKEVNLFYCGHGTPSGEIVLKDGNYSGEKFDSFLKNLELTYYPNITIYLNCCYALYFVDHIFENCFKTFFETFRILDEKSDSVDENISSYKLGLSKEINLDQLKNESIEEPRSIDIKKLEKILKLPEEEFEKNVMKMYEKETRIFSKKLGDHVFNFVPLSFSKMNASGYLFTNKSNDSFKEFRNFVEDQNINKTKLEENFKDYTAKDQDYKVETYKEPTVYIFQAKDGDSSLFCFESNCILIDGGRVCPSETNPKPPCFWHKLKEFKQVDCVILTHGDADHWGGLLPLLCAQNEIPEQVPKISKFVMFWSNEESGNKCAKSILKINKRDYHHAYHIGDYVNTYLSNIFEKSVDLGKAYKFGNIELTYIYLKEDMQRYIWI
eukprot:gene12912-7424_t